MDSVLAFENAKLNIECGYACLTNAMYMAKNRRVAADCVVQSVKISELDNNYQKNAEDLLDQLIEKKEEMRTNANAKITELRQQARQEKKRILTEIEKASKRYYDATKAAELSKITINSNIPVIQEIPENAEEIEKIREKLQRVNEQIDKLNPKKAQWESLLNELAEIEKNRAGHSPQKKKAKNNFKNIMNS